VAAILGAAGLGAHEAVRLACDTDLSPKAAAAALAPEASAARILANAGRALPAELKAAQARLMRKGR
jgi:hypothetical protein